MNRREFIGSMLAAGALPSGGDVRKESPADLGTERLRIGALSDIHIKGTQAQPCFEKTLRTLDAWKADGVMASAISPTTGCGSSWSSSRANDYEVTAILRQGDVERVLCQKRVFSLRYLFGDKRTPSRSSASSPRRRSRTAGRSATRSVR